MMSWFKRKKKKLDVPGVPENLGNVLSRLQGGESTKQDEFKIASGKTAEDIVPRAFKIKRQKEEKEAREEHKAFIASLEVGQLVKGRGIYLGVWKPRDEAGKSLNQIFDLYAAPKNLKRKQSFNDVMECINALKDWHGHDGGCFRTEGDVIDAVTNCPEMLSNWFIPTSRMLDSHIYINRKKISWKNRPSVRWRYWSCTTNENEKIVVINLENRGRTWVSRLSQDKNSIRPVRAELRLQK